jgi:hypothetical protein
MPKYLAQHEIDHNYLHVHSQVEGNSKYDVGRLPAVLLRTSKYPNSASKLLQVILDIKGYSKNQEIYGTTKH